jgi:UDP-glucose 4-epimerase
VTIYGDGDQTRDFVSVHDVARAVLLAATRPGLASGAANICTGRPTSVNGLAAILGSLFPGAAAPRRAAARSGDIRHSVGDPSRAAADLGFGAEWSVERGLGELAGGAAA